MNQESWFSKVLYDLLPIVNDVHFPKNWYITLAFVAEVFVAIKLMRNRSELHRRNSSDPRTRRRMAKSLANEYNLFTSLITLFPVLGMLGTVIALLGLDTSPEKLEAAQSSFFTALTSTAAGLIFSAVFKVMHAWIGQDTERLIAENTRAAAEQDDSDDGEALL